MKNDKYLWAWGALTLWDASTTLFGSLQITGYSPEAIIFCIIGSLALTGLLLMRTKLIIMNPKKTFAAWGEFVMLVVAIGYDLFTAYNGHYKILGHNNSGNNGVWLSMIFTALTCYSPIALSYIIYPDRDTKTV